MNYYYLDGVNKKGPFTKEEIMNLHLLESTWVYGDGMDNWKLLSQVAELQSQPVVNHSDNNKTESTTNFSMKERFSLLEYQKSQKTKLSATFFLKTLCSITMFVLCIYNIVLASKFIGNISWEPRRGYGMEEFYGLLIIGVALLLGTTIIAFAIFSKSVFDKSNKNNPN